MLVRLCWALVTGVAALVVAQIGNFFLHIDAAVASRTLHAASGVTILDPHVQMQVLRELPERVTALATYHSPDRRREEVFVGTGGSGGVFRFLAYQPSEILEAIALGLGDRVKFGTCEVSSLAACDLNQDGTPELLAETSQIHPRGRPRLYAWSLGSYPTLLGVARPDIKSSWSHGLGFVFTAHQNYPSVFSTFCGYGEIVEYHLTKDTNSSGFQMDGISWRQVGQLPTSGEHAVAADADNDGQTDLCVASGYSLGGAAIRIYEIGPDGVEPQPRHLIDESERFGNVRFLVGDLATDGTRELVAWWISDLSGGDCEIVRYHLGADGLRNRTVIARGDGAMLWPLDGQMAQADIDDDGNPEVWFLTGSGNLWRYQPNESPPVTRVSFIGGSGGPLAASAPAAGERQCLYLGRDRSVLQVQSIDR